MERTDPRDRLSPRVVWIASIAAVVAVAIRLHNALSYPLDWGFDGPFIWKYISLQLLEIQAPAPDAGANTSDPPGFYAAAALLIRGLSLIDRREVILRAIPILGTIAGLGIAWLAHRLALALDPGNQRRALIAGGLVLYLPAHIQMSAMVNEEIWSAVFISVAVFLLATRQRPSIAGLRGAAGVGVACGLALLVKLSGALALLTAGATYALDGLRERAFRGAVVRIAVLALLALAIGGWFYLRNQLVYGALHPHDLPQHAYMHSMPPGERSIGDFVRFPLAAFWHPQLLDEDLLRSVWGSVYVTVWFDGHRFFLPRDDTGVTWLGRATLVLALLPTLAFAVGALRGARRALASRGGPEVPLLFLTTLTFAGCAWYAVRNPWFASVKGTYLLGVCLPFAWYASEVLDGWSRRGRGAAWVVGLGLTALALCVALGTPFDAFFAKTELPGLEWR